MENTRFHRISKLLIEGVIIFFLVFSYSLLWSAAAAEKPQYGGTLNFAIEVDPPSYDAHREQTYNMVHPTAPHYSLLVKFDPENYPRIVGDLAESWTVSKDHNTNLRDGVD